MRIAVTGASGGLGSELCGLIESAYSGWEVVRLTRENADLLDPAKIEKTVQVFKPDVIIHTASMTGVDGCETDKELAESVNIVGTRALVNAAKSINARLVFISTDYVFDGEKEGAYLESDTPHPLNVYGTTKLEGERVVGELEGSLVIRTSWLFGKTGKNFVKKMLDLAEKGELIRIVNDQAGSPTFYPHLASGILKLIESKASGVFHITNSGFCTWFDYAKAIFEIEGIDIKITPVTSEEYASPARRPKNSRLDCSKYIEIAGGPLPDWRDALKESLGV